MVYIILSILGILATITVKSKWNYKIQTFFMFFVLIIGSFLFLGIVFSLEYMGIIEKGAASFFVQIPWIEIALYFVMIAGMEAKYIYDWIGSGKGRQKKFQKWQMLKPMFVSPLVFGSIYASMSEISSFVLLFVFAFQNGFFWQTVLQKTER